jgi:NADH dehydrogenase
VKRAAQRRIVGRQVAKIMISRFSSCASLSRRPHIVLSFQYVSGCCINSSSFPNSSSPAVSSTSDVQSTSSSSPFAAAKNKLPTVVVVGSGWAGYRVAHDLNKTLFNVKVISPRNHFLFTPLLPSTAVGTLEFRAIQEPVRTIPGIDYYQAEVTSIDFGNQRIHCSDIFQHKYDFDLQYDSLILAPGAETNTFNIKGIQENEGKTVFFLKQLSHSRGIRNRLIDCFERAASPGVVDNETKKCLLTFLVVGGGPTSIEFAAELYDFLTNDVKKWYPDLLPFVSVKIIETTDHILGSFSLGLVNYVENLFVKRQIELVTAHSVKEIRDDNVAVLNDGTTICFGLMVWSTGIKQVPFITSLSKEKVAKFSNHKLKIDDYLHVLSVKRSQMEGNDPKKVVEEYDLINNGRVYALGDCAGHVERPLPALAQVASQQGKYIAKQLNYYGIKAMAKSTNLPILPGGARLKADCKPFQYTHLGSMAQVGQWKGVYDSPHTGRVIISHPFLSVCFDFFLSSWFRRWCCS